ncbi:kynurenine/alpha-aminoadipate aminotransferase, mitochondrial isoform X2 [Cephus cinctus]|uniref:Kynurenine/alpha-aminoadipate aminotransferase, mitochondrial isoform X2 n=1 Tax=Cephus cinctus TaxID=211228 RepID=A0AAJ7R728_CEPCN|nr:kynurenine/alpha-aminoadipate aminotransferase, mitochondrial isoform X2 [Cephus cinctus]
MHKYVPQIKMDYSHFKTDVSKRRRSAATRELTKIAYAAPHNVISLAEGMPNEETFPFVEMRVKLNDGSSFVLEGEELGAALQYIPSQGYPLLLQIAPHLVELIPVVQDDFGIDPIGLRETLRSRRYSGKKMPKIMYINATGANPTGTVLSLERRKEIYRIACEYNFLILDDDPYHFMYFTEEAPKSFLSLDTEGRVIRLDSFSKVLSSGLRLGFITAAAPLVASIELHMQSSHLHAPTLSQVIAYKLLKIWGYEKMMEHFRRIRLFYKQRRDLIAGLAKKHLHGLAEFSLPSAGFFLWIKVWGIKDTWKMVMQRGVTHGVLMAPGAAFMADPSQPCNAIRASFAKASYEEMDLALERLAILIREELVLGDSITDSEI